jgi:hypothetical protein
MARVAKQRRGVRLLDHRAEVHDRHPGGDVLDDRQVVADEDVGQVEIPPQVQQQIQDLRLDRHVERGGRFVADHQVRLHDQCARDRHPLALSAGKLPRCAVGVP